MSKVVNIYGGPSIGKSTMAAEVYSKLSRLGKSVELVREVAKGWVWEKRVPISGAQFTLTAQQIYEESKLLGQVDYIVTDSPVVLGPMYCKDQFLAETLAQLTESYVNWHELCGHGSWHFLLARDDSWHRQNGRWHNLEQSKAVDTLCREYCYSQSTYSVYTVTTADQILSILGVSNDQGPKAP